MVEPEDGIIGPNGEPPLPIAPVVAVVSPVDCTNEVLNISPPHVLSKSWYAATMRVLLTYRLAEAVPGLPVRAFSQYLGIIQRMNVSTLSSSMQMVRARSCTIPKTSCLPTAAPIHRSNSSLKLTCHSAMLTTEVKARSSLQTRVVAASRLSKPVMGPVWGRVDLLLQMLQHDNDIEE
jgi:hypothetical protein